MKNLGWSILLAFSGAMMMVLIANAQSPRAEVSFYSDVNVTSQQPVKIKDVASISFFPVELEKEILETVLHPGVNANQTLDYTNSELTRLLRKNVMKNPKLRKMQISYFVPEKVKLRGRESLISVINLKNEIVSAFRQKCQDCLVTIKDLKLPKTAGSDPLQGVMPKNSWNTWNLDTSDLKISNSFLLPLKLEGQAGAETLWISGQVRLEKLVPTALRRIAPGENIKDSDVRIEMMDIAMAKDAVASTKDLSQLVSAKYIQAHQPIFKSDLRKEYVVTRGQPVKAVLGSELFEVSGSMVAEESGGIGDTVKLKPATSPKGMEAQKILVGEVVDKGVVKIQ